METQQVKTLYTLKATAGQHLKNKQFTQAAVYYSDIIAKLQTAIEKLESEQDMEKIIKQIKIPSHKNLSLCHLKLNQYAACIQQCQEVLKIQSNCLKTLYRIAKAYMSLQQYSEAQKYLKRGFAIDPNEQQIQKALSQIETAKNPIKPTQKSYINLKNLIAIILYWPLLIFNGILGIIFGKPTKQEKKERED